MRSFPTSEPPDIRHLLRSIESSLEGPLESVSDGRNLGFLRALRRKAETEALPAYLVGGPVRDALLGRRVKDLDLVLEGDAVGLARELAVETGWDIVVHQRFGTATLSNGEARVDLVTARREGYPSPGALPEVVPGSISDDLARRDFTINSMALAIDTPDGQVLDPHGGQADLDNGLIRTLHPRSFEDDPTRLFRAVRYEQRFGFRLEGGTEEQLRRALVERWGDAVTGDRLRHELERVFDEDNPAAVLRRAAEIGVLGAIHPGLGAGAFEPMTGLGSLGSAGPLAYWGTMIYPLGAGAAGEVMQRLNVPSRWRKVAEDTIQIRGMEERLAAPGLLTSTRWDLLEGRDEAAVAAVGGGTRNAAAAGRLSEYLAEYLEEGGRFRPALDGDAIVAMGVPAGKQVGKLLRRLRAARLDRVVQTEAEERALVADFMSGTRAGQQGRRGGRD